MWEQGYTSDLRVRLFQLKDLVWRAVRAIVDVGLHCKGMSFNEAVNWLVNEAHLEYSNAVAEVRRYTASPTQPLSYLTGKWRFLGCVKSARERKAQTSPFNASTTACLPVAVYQFAWLSKCCNEGAVRLIFVARGVIKELAACVGALGRRGGCSAAGQTRAAVIFLPRSTPSLNNS